MSLLSINHFSLSFGSSTVIRSISLSIEPGEMLAIVGCSAVILTIAYFTYGRLLSRLFLLDDRTPTPANTLRDDVDYVPCETAPLLSQHFSAIAAAGPIVGPILAGLAFGWLPALLWILLGSIFVGGVHDFASLVASISIRVSARCTAIWKIAAIR